MRPVSSLHYRPLPLSSANRQLLTSSPTSNTATNTRYNYYYPAARTLSPIPDPRGPSIQRAIPAWCFRRVAFAFPFFAVRMASSGSASGSGGGGTGGGNTPPLSTATRAAIHIPPDAPSTLPSTSTLTSTITSPFQPAAPFSSSVPPTLAPFADISDFARQLQAKQQHSNYHSTSLSTSLKNMVAASVNRTTLHPSGV
ncbi:hypothetical protein GX51_07747, partial [Blastomyces parvus]